MATFDFSRLDQFAGTSTSIRRPREFAYFSYNDQHELRPLSTESLSYYHPPMFGTPGPQRSLVDLSAGFDSFIQRDDSMDEHLDGLLDTLQAHEERLMVQVHNGQGNMSDIRTKADVVTWRGMMTKILTAAFDDFNEFEMNATCYQGTIYIEENHAHKDAERRSQRQQPARRGQASQEMMQYWGYKFETLSVLKKPWAEVSRAEIEGRESDIVNNHAQYCSIVRTGIGNTSMILAGEVDAVLGEIPDNPDSVVPWVELKTSQELQGSHPREMVKFERKLLKYWAQSFLLGVPHIIVGFRTQDGHLTRIQDLRTQKLPGQVKNGQRTWDGNVCINFTAAFLDLLKRTVTGDGVWRILHRKGERRVEIVQTEMQGTGQILKPNFKAHRESLMALEISQALGEGEKAINT